MKPLPLIIIAIVFFFASCGEKNVEQGVKSPNNSLRLNVELKDGVLYYDLKKGDTTVIAPSKAGGFVMKNQPSLNGNFKIIKTDTLEFSEVWQPLWGEQKNIENTYNELKVYMETTDQPLRKLNVIFRLFNDGLGFRYEIPKQKNMNEFAIMEEQTQFAMSGNHSSWWIPAYKPERYEYLYKNTPISEIDTVHTPFTLKTAEGLYLYIHEANLTDYASMTLYYSPQNTLQSDLYPWADGVKVYGKTPFVSPWRTIVVGKTPGDLVASNIDLNLNEPCAIENTSWIKTGKYIGIWWEMHIGKSTWASGEKHGANTKNVKKYMDFAEKYGFNGVLVEGWNITWDVEWWKDGSKFRFTEPYPDFNIEEITQYGQKKNVSLVGHHETGGAVENYESQLEDAFIFYNKYGVKVVKTGYVGSRMNGKEWHHSQYGVRHYRRVLELAAKYNIMIVAHETIKETGLRRTFPNYLSSEAARGQEYDAWSADGGNPPNHTTIIPFTRLLAGPMDFTPGVFELTLKDKPNNQVNTTLAKQLALYVIIHSPMQMAADLPENYLNQKAFQFILDVPVNWESTQVLDSEIGEYVTVVRKDINSDDWYLGSITNENARELEIDLSFLSPEKKYLAQIYADSDESNYKTNPTAHSISEMEVTANQKLKLAAGGGQAIRFKSL